jgi:PIN like domain/Restriction endonuclease
MAEQTGRRLTLDFAGWLDPSSGAPQRFVEQGLVVLDANVLLSLYRIAPGPRAEVLAALTAVGDRLWVPHQAALEFSRNRKDAVHDRVRAFASVKLALTAAPETAMDVLESAIGQFRQLRQRSATTRPWGRAEDGFDADALLARLNQAMAPVLAELEAMHDEHDLHPRDLSSVDPVLKQIDAVVTGRIGAGYPSARLAQLVDHAISFRYPNEIPPGFRDGGKETPIRRAGDFLLWQQTIDRANELAQNERLVLLVTNDLKDDWWELDNARTRLGPRPELVQELRDRAGADLALRTLDEFVADAKTHLPVRVSEATVETLRKARHGLERSLPSALHDPSARFSLMDLSPEQFDRLVYDLLVRLGFSGEIPDASEDGSGFTLTERDATGHTVVAVKHVRSMVGGSTIMELLGAMRATGAAAGLVVTTASFADDADRLAGFDGTVRLIDGPELLRLLAEHLDMHVRI